MCLGYADFIYRVTEAKKGICLVGSWVDIYIYTVVIWGSGPRQLTNVLGGEHVGISLNNIAHKCF